MPQVRVETMTPVIERSNTVHTLHIILLLQKLKILDNCAVRSYWTEYVFSGASYHQRGQRSRSNVGWRIWRAAYTDSRLGPTHVRDTCGLGQIPPHPSGYVTSPTAALVPAVSQVREFWNASFIHQWLYSPLLGPNRFFSFIAANAWIGL
jgi:hypothetical protein